MSGQAYAKVECFSWYTGTNVYQNAQEFFKGLYDFLVYLETQGVVTLRARYAGVGATSAAAVGYWDEPDPFTSNAWYLFEWRTDSTTPANSSYTGVRNEPFYILVQWVQYNNTWSAGNSNPGLCQGVPNNNQNENWVAIQMGVGIGGDKMPWNGTLGTYGTPSSFGSQAKGNPVWDVPTGGDGLYVFPRSNNSGGAHNTAKQNMNLVYTTAYNSTPARYHFLADHDGLLFLVDDANNVNYHFCYTGSYKRRDNLTSQDPYVMMGGLTVAMVGSATYFGGIAGTSNDNGGIAFSTYGNYEVRNLKTSYLDEFMGYNGNQMQPNRLFSVPTYDDMPCLIGVAEYYDGCAGEIDFFRVIQNSANLEFNLDKSKIIIGTPTVTNYKLLVPWISSVNPLSGAYRNGVTGACG
jgi:hypothetical protein